jgi:hypothetical protein
MSPRAVIPTHRLRASFFRASSSKTGLPGTTGSFLAFDMAKQEATMQLIDTRVSANDDHTVTVVFAGEGNEEISVRLAEGGLQDQEAILRAKAVMVQLTSFEQPNGDVIGRTAAKGGIGSTSGVRLFENGDTDREG